MYKSIIRPLLFSFNPERVHEFTTRMLVRATKIGLVRNWLDKRYRAPTENLEKQVMGLTFKNPIGLAAGFDKNAMLYPAFSTLGFGFIEVGTVTPRPQSGNPKPRMFRLPEDSGLINRMGFNNEGVAAAVQRLKEHRDPTVVIGGNIGKNKTTPNDQAWEDYQKCFEALHPLVDYFVVNVSSPNTPDLRALQDKAPLKTLLQRLQELNQKKKKPRPVLLKIAPDLNTHQLDDIVEIVKATELDGVIATNTTLDRTGLSNSNQKEQGGLSGKPLRKKSTEIIRYLRKRLGAEAVIVGVGGVFSGQDALEKLEAGADLVQVYTGFIYEGPGMVKRMVTYLSQHMKKNS